MSFIISRAGYNQYYFPLDVLITRAIMYLTRKFKCLFNEVRFNKDVTQDRIKLFLQSPESLFSFEAEREAAIPDIVTYIHKLCVVFTQVTDLMNHSFFIHFGRRFHLIWFDTTDIMRLFGGQNVHQLIHGIFEDCSGGLRSFGGFQDVM